MLRCINFLFLSLIIVSFTSLYHIRYEAEKEIKVIKNALYHISAEKQTHQILQAEWVSLNNPVRLETLAGNSLHLFPMDSVQIISWSDWNVSHEYLPVSVMLSVDIF